MNHELIRSSREPLIEALFLLNLLTIIWIPLLLIFFSFWRDHVMLLLRLFLQLLCIPHFWSVSVSSNWVYCILCNISYSRVIWGSSVSCSTSCCSCCENALRVTVPLEDCMFVLILHSFSQISCLGFHSSFNSIYSTLQWNCQKCWARVEMVG